MSEMMTERQLKWFSSLRESLPVKTGKTLEAWVEVMRQCPETATRARLQWLKLHHGIGQNYGSMILSTAFPSDFGGWDEPEAMRTRLWKDHAILVAIEAHAAQYKDVIQTQRKTYTAFSRKVQFAALRPIKAGGAIMGLRLEVGVSARLSPSQTRESWSERLGAQITLPDVSAVDAEVLGLFDMAAQKG